MVAPKQFVRIDLYAKRNPALTLEQFHEHWQEVHVPLVKQLLARHPKIKRYSTYFTPPELYAQVAKGPVPILNYDGHAEILAESLEALAKMRQDLFYLEQVAPDEMRLLDFSSANQSVGYETIWVDNI